MEIACDIYSMLEKWNGYPLTFPYFLLQDDVPFGARILAK